MRWIAAGRERLRALFFGARQDAEMEEELRFHLERETELLREAGLGPREARRQARLRFGGVERFKEEVREARGIMVLEDFFKDVKLALRGLRRSPGFTAVVLTMLALGIGANTAIFSVIHAVLLEPLPFREPDKLVQVFETHRDQGWDQFPFSEPNLLDLMETSTSFDGIAGTIGGARILSGEGPPERVVTRVVTPGFYQILGVTPVLGRTFEESDVVGQQPLPVLLLGEDAWVTRFGADPAIIGRTVQLDGSGFEVVGVLPRDGPWLWREFYLPMALNPESRRDNHNFSAVARLRDGVTIEAARAELTPLARRVTERNAPIDEGMDFRVEPSTIWAASADLRVSLWVLMGAVGVLLLIACMNLANLLLGRVAKRRRQVALCVALGASRARVVRQLFTESAVLSMTGSVLGILVATAGVQALVALEPGNIPQLENVELNGAVLLFTLTLALVTGILGGLLPALRLPYDHLSETLRDGGRSGHSRSQVRVRGGLVAAETALSLVLLVGAGLLIRSLVAVHGVDPGFDPEGRLTFTVNLPSSYTGSVAVASDFRQEVLGRIRALPQVQSAAAGSFPPMGGFGVMVVLPGDETVESFGAGLPADWRIITDDYFRSIGRALVEGRDLSQQRTEVGPDDPPPPQEVVISRRLAEAVWPGEHAVGRQLQAVAPFSGLWNVVGVVEDMRERGPGQDETMAFYYSFDAVSFGWPVPAFVVHAHGDPRALLPTIRGILDQIDPDLPMSNVRTMDEMMQNSTASRRFTMSLLAVFAGVALVLALSGLYGVIADSVSQRSRELGVRVALGASPSDVMGLVIRQGMVPAVLGIGVGLVGATGMSRVLQSLLFGVGATDAVTYAVMGGFLALAALVACWAPACAALKLDPVAVLKEE